MLAEFHSDTASPKLFFRELWGAKKADLINWIENFTVELIEKNAVQCLLWPQEKISAKQTLNENNIFVLFYEFSFFGDSLDGEFTFSHFY